MVAQVAGGCEEGRFSVFVAAIARYPVQASLRLLYPGAVFIVQGKFKNPQGILQIGALAEPGTHEYAPHFRLVQQIARCDIGDRSLVFGSYLLQAAQQLLE